jgi:L-threonylcarbamoyladenylate synthase
MDNSKEINKAIEIVKNGGTFLYPTETVIGLGCDATNESAILKLKQIKLRSEEKSFIILVDSIDMIKRFCISISQLEIDLLNQKKPTTVILNNIKSLPKSLLFTDGSIGVRITQHPVIKDFITTLNCPIVSTSANVSGEPTIDSWKNVNPVILERIDYALNLHTNFTTTQTPSQIVKVVKGETVFIRR